MACHREMAMFVFLSDSRLLSFEDMGAQFPLDPIFLRFFTASLHLIVLPIVLNPWLYQTFSSSELDENHKHSRGNHSFSYYKTTLLSCLGLSFFDLIMCLFYLFSWWENNILTLSDLGVKTLCWLALYLFLQFCFVNSSTLLL